MAILLPIKCERELLLRNGEKITVIKQNTLGQATVRYEGEILEHRSNGLVLEALWTQPARDLGYTRFEPGDRFTEYYYTDRWFNVFKITGASGALKGWYCNIATPAHIFDDSIEQIDLFLDVWVTPQGDPLILDEEEFALDTTLSAEQRQAAQQGLQALLTLLKSQQEAFSSLTIEV